MICSIRADSATKMDCDGALHSVIEVWTSLVFMYYSFCHWQALSWGGDSTSGAFKYSYQCRRRAHHEDWSRAADSVRGCARRRESQGCLVCLYTLVVSLDKFSVHSAVGPQPAVANSPSSRYPRLFSKTRPR